MDAPLISQSVVVWHLGQSIIFLLYKEGTKEETRSNVYRSERGEPSLATTPTLQAQLETQFRFSCVPTKLWKLEMIGVASGGIRH